MESRLTIIDPTTHPGWDDLVLSNRNYSFFHSSSWARAIKDTYHFRPLYFTLIDAGAIKVLVPIMEIKNPLLPKKGVSLPFTDMSDPIIDDTVDRKIVFDEIEAYGKNAGWKYLEIKGDAHFDEDVPFTQFWGHTLDITDNEDDIYRGFANGTKGNIKKSLREGMEVTINGSSESIDAFYSLQSITRKRHGLPPQPRSFFEQVKKSVLSTGNGFVALASFKGKIVAGAVFFHFGTKAVYKYAASDVAYQNLRANNLVLWEAIRWFSARKYTSLSLGRTEPDNDGLRYFKNGWGTTEQIVKYYKYDVLKNTYSRENVKVPGMYTAIFKKMPSPILNAVGSIMYRYVA